MPNSEEGGAHVWVIGVSAPGLTEDLRYSLLKPDNIQWLEKANKIVELEPHFASKYWGD